MTGSVATVLAVVLSATASAVLVRSRPRLSLGSTSVEPASRGRAPAATRDRHLPVVAVLAGLAPVLLVGGAVGVVGGVVGGIVAYRLLARRLPAGERRRRAQLTRGLPRAVDLLAVALAAGSAPTTALTAVLAAVDGPVADELAVVRRGLVLGRDPVQVWREVAARPGLAALGRTMVRAVDSGAPVVESLHRLSEDLRAASRAEADSRARTVGVRAAVPLGLCLLPAFLLVGVVPLVAGTVSAVVLR